MLFFDRLSIFRAEKALHLVQQMVNFSNIHVFDEEKLKYVIKQRKVLYL